jgi:hypothetical protein
MRREVTQLTSFALSIILSIASVIYIITLNLNDPLSDYILGIPFSIGLAVQLVLIVLIARKLNVWKFIYLALLIMAYTPFVDISLFGWEINGLDIITTILIIVHLAFNSELISVIINQAKHGESDDVKILDKKNTDLENKINSFMTKYASKSDLELKKIATDSNFDPAAREAAQRLIEK